MQFVLTDELIKNTGLSEFVINAGVDASLDHDARFEGIEEAVFRIYTAMRMAELSSSQEDSKT